MVAEDLPATRPVRAATKKTPARKSFDVRLARALVLKMPSLRLGEAILKTPNMATRAFVQSFTKD